VHVGILLLKQLIRIQMIIISRSLLPFASHFTLQCWPPCNVQTFNLYPAGWILKFHCLLYIQHEYYLEKKKKTKQNKNKKTRTFQKIKKVMHSIIKMW